MLSSDEVVLRLPWIYFSYNTPHLMLDFLANGNLIFGLLFEVNILFVLSTFDICDVSGALVRHVEGLDARKTS